MSEDLAKRRAIAEALLGGVLDAEGFAACPGKYLHNGPDGVRDFQILLDGAPTARCFHSSCLDVIEAFNQELRSRIGKAESSRGDGSPPPAPMMGNVPPAPEPERKKKRPGFDSRKLEGFAKRVPFPITEEWLATRSPVEIPKEQGPETALAMLSALYQKGERVLIFAKEFSQGCFLWEAGGETWRLAEVPGVAAVKSPLPIGGPLGIWFLANPVTGGWLPNPNNRDKDGCPKMGRRHRPCITAWRFMVLESDLAAPELWMRALVQLPLPIVAIYTSGGKSVHALVRVEASCKEEWDALRDDLVPILCPLGADAAAMTAVRLTRLPGMLRHGTRDKAGAVKAYPAPRLQRLLWLNPRAPAVPILGLTP